MTMTTTTIMIKTKNTDDDDDYDDYDDYGNTLMDEVFCHPG